jgi:hypothetical protein
MRWLLNVQQKWHDWLHDHSGVATIFTMLTIAILLGFAAMVVDVGHIVVARGELQNAADAAALAGARGYFPNAPPSGTPVPPDSISARAAAENYVNKNYADTQGLTIAPGDIHTGVWHWGNPGHFEETNVAYVHNTSTILAIQVTVRKDDTSNNPVSMTLARIFGVTEVNAQATAVAINEMPLGGTQKCGTSLFAVPKGCADNACASPNKEYVVHLRNDSDDNAGWASIIGSMSAERGKCLAQLIGTDCAVTLKKSCTTADCDPSIEVGGTIFTQNGVDSSIIQTLKDTLDKCTSCGKTLTLQVPVVEGECNSVKWNGTKKIVGVTTFTITQVDGPPVNTITGFIDCNTYTEVGPPAPPGAEFFGTVSLVPKLAQ